MGKYKFSLFMSFFIISFVLLSCGHDDTDSPDVLNNNNPEKQVEPEIDLKITSLHNDKLRIGDEIIMNGVFGKQNNKVYVYDSGEKSYFTITSENEQQIICRFPDNIVKEGKEYYYNSLFITLGEKEAQYNFITIYSKDHPFVRSVDKEIYKRNDKIILTGYNFDPKDPDLQVYINYSGYGDYTTDYFKLKEKKISVNKEGTEIIVDTSKTILYFSGEWNMYVKSNGKTSNPIKVKFSVK